MRIHVNLDRRDAWLRLDPLNDSRVQASRKVNGLHRKPIQPIALRPEIEAALFGCHACFLAPALALVLRDVEAHFVELAFPGTGYKRDEENRLSSVGDTTGWCLGKRWDSE